MEKNKETTLEVVGFGVQGFWVRVEGSGFRVQGSRLRVQALRFREGLV